MSVRNLASAADAPTPLAQGILVAIVAMCGHRHLLELAAILMHGSWENCFSGYIITMLAFKFVTNIHFVAYPPKLATYYRGKLCSMPSASPHQQRNSSASKTQKLSADHKSVRYGFFNLTLNYPIWLHARLGMNECNDVNQLNSASAVNHSIRHFIPKSFSIAFSTPSDSSPHSQNCKNRMEPNNSMLACFPLELTHNGT